MHEINSHQKNHNSILRKLMLHQSTEQKEHKPLKKQRVNQSFHKSSPMINYLQSISLCMVH